MIFHSQSRPPRLFISSWRHVLKFIVIFIEDTSTFLFWPRAVSHLLSKLLQCDRYKGWWPSLSGDFNGRSRYQLWYFRTRFIFNIWWKWRMETRSVRVKNVKKNDKILDHFWNHVISLRRYATWRNVLYLLINFW